MEKKQLRTIIIAAVIVIVGAVAAIYVYTQKQTEIKALMAEQMDLNEMIQQKDSVVNDLVTTFDEIESNLTFIKEKRSQLSLEQAEGGKDRKQALLEDITLMNSMLEESSKKIAELEEKLKKSGLNLRAFERRVAALNESIESQNVQIAELKQIIEQKDFQMAELNSKIEEMGMEMAKQADSISYKDQVITDKVSKLNTGHIAYGTYKELAEKGILTKEGGILGIGASKTLQQNLDEEYFTTLDIRESTVIPLHTKKAKVISEHPSDSYKLVEEEGQIAYLQIENPDKFWKISKYAVIEVK
ncbi:hypothetical protein [Gaoshiqia sediminis]|uniref:Uncharacterized protein n=1 Tax=Gaoshiqia sediminis TaxID=2986998 RepID=A0AA41YBC7_9BACT|nr:hypothetical protein [Gaoshiqia sediminis]MCW0483038.1 hypothetical protein [Gaoshiqia sediminis]